MTDSQSPKEGDRRALPEFRVTRPQPWVKEEALSITLTGENICVGNSTNVTDSKRSFRNQNFSANHEGNTSRKRPREQLEQWLDNEILFPSTPGCQLVDSPIILEALIEGFLVRRIYVDEGSSSEVMYKHCFRNLRAEIRKNLKQSRTLLVGFSGEVSYLIGTIILNVTMGEPERLQTIPMEFAVVKSHSPYNVILGRTGLRSLGAVDFTIHSMIKFPIANGIEIMITKRETLHECRRMEEAHGPAMEGRITLPLNTSIGPPEKDTQTDEKVKGKYEHLERPPESKPPEKVVIHDNHPDQTVTIKGNLSVKCRSGLIEIL
nr:reverse transcriptase domain-containing protein [Tanacetum cinerariifolium]